MKYEETVRRICGENWREFDADERDGAYGVAVALAFLDGTRANLDEIAKTLGVEPVEIEAPYRRLGANGFFSMRNNARRDRCLNGYSSAADARTAWCHVAAVASGFVGNGYYIQRPGSQSPQRIQGSNNNAEATSAERVAA